MQGKSPRSGAAAATLTAIAIASAIKADICQIYTDVEGVFTCDPRIVPTARKLDEISYDEMLEMASSGSKVMQSRLGRVRERNSRSFSRSAAASIKILEPLLRRKP
jgi:aspartate kinase